MKKLLRIDTSRRKNDSHSRDLAYTIEGTSMLSSDVLDDKKEALSRLF